MNERLRLSKEALYFKFPTLLADICIQLAVLWALMYGTDMIRERNMVIYEKTGTILLLVLSTIISAVILGIHLNERNRSAAIIAGQAVLNAGLTWAIFNGLMAIIYELTLQGKALTLQLVSVAVLTATLHLIIRWLIGLIRKKGANHHTVIMVGMDENMLSIYNFMTQERYNDKGFSVLGFFADKAEGIPEGSQLLGKVEDVFAYVEAQPLGSLKEVFCSLNPATDTETVNRLVSLCENRLSRFTFVPNMKGYPKRKLLFSTIGNVHVIALHDEPLNDPLSILIKRFGDIILSGLFLCTLYPFIWLFCAIGIKLSSPGPVYLRQKRTGYEGKEFYCLKFRSMHISTDADNKQAVKGDSRIFPFGEFLRRTSIDELPQFINVFKGDMSIIGPRPHMLHHTDIYSELIGDYMVRHFAKPGITGWAQVNGSRGETKEVSEMKKRVDLDIWYIENWSIGLDISIFFMTVWQLLKGGGEKAY